MHDIHLSNTQIHYKSEESTIQLTLKLFADDLELAVKEEYDEELKLFADRELPYSDSIIQLYIKQHLDIEVNNKKLQGQFIGKELSDDLSSVWCYIEFMDIDVFKNVAIKNTLLMELFDDQQNMLIIKVDNIRKAHHVFDINQVQINLTI